MLTFLHFQLMFVWSVANSRCEPQFPCNGPCTMIHYMVAKWRPETQLRGKQTDAKNVLRPAFGDYVRQVVAIYSASGSTWTIEQVAVKLGSQGRGNGSALINIVELDEKYAGVLAIELETADMMTELLWLYHKHGFRNARKGLPKYIQGSFVRASIKKAISRLLIPGF